VRAVIFLTVGAFGFLVQMAALAVLLMIGSPYLLATALAVELAVLHNFFWHERWTWADRTRHAYGVVSRLARFNLTTGAMSLAGNLGFTAIYVGSLGLNPLIANGLAVASTAAVNFLIADRWIFSGAALAIAILTCPSKALAAELAPETIEAWHKYVKITEARIEGETPERIARSTFNRRSPTLLTSRSVATRIDQVEDAGKPGERTLRGGDDYGFLWRLNSYWRYSQIDGGVRIELESLTLSREVPLLVRPLAIPMVESVARGSMIRTLETVSRWLTPGT